MIDIYPDEVEAKLKEIYSKLTEDEKRMVEIDIITRLDSILLSYTVTGIPTWADIIKNAPENTCSGECGTCDCSKD